MTPTQQAQKAVDDWIKDRDETVALWNRNGIQSHYREINVESFPEEIQQEMLKILEEKNLL